ncbi:MAG: hypothetical protein CMJ78_22365 [Planctomycetaceae bacterium]|nr:hypothetical protein [Planctomycetaceae bacterium]
MPISTADDPVAVARAPEEASNPTLEAVVYRDEVTGITITLLSLLPLPSSTITNEWILRQGVTSSVTRIVNFLSGGRMTGIYASSLKDDLLDLDFADAATSVLSFDLSAINDAGTFGDIMKFPLDPGGFMLHQVGLGEDRVGAVFDMTANALDPEAAQSLLNEVHSHSWAIQFEELEYYEPDYETNRTFGLVYEFEHNVFLCSNYDESFFSDFHIPAEIASGYLKAFDAVARFLKEQLGLEAL